MHVTIATVNEVLYDGTAQSMTVPGADGEMTLLAKHMPLITTLKEGTITLRNGDTREFPITEGILEVGREGIVVIL